MLTAPNSEIYLLKTPIELDNNNQLDFTNAVQQHNYFNGLNKINISEATFQRKDGTLRYPGNSEALLGYNYCMYRNKNHGNKWFYAFVTNVEWLSENSSAITLKTDVWQTYMFDITFKTCLVDREHVNDDTRGKHTLPENLELGDLVVNTGTVDFGPSAIDEYYSDNYWIVADVTMIENTGENTTLSYSWAGGTSYNTKPRVNGIPSGTYHLLLGKYDAQGAPDMDIKDLTDCYDLAGLGDAILSIYIVPKSLISQVRYGLTIVATHTTPTVTESRTIIVAVPTETWAATSLGPYTFTPLTTLNGYTPKNNKLLTFPYCYFNISNNAGTVIPYHYEDFDATEGVKFKGMSALCPSGSVKIAPVKYKKSASGNMYDYGISGPKYPICAWTNDTYTNWLTQNSVNMQAQWTSTLIQGGLNVVGQAGSYGMVGGPVGAGVGAAVGAAQLGLSLFNLAREQHVAKSNANLVPDVAKGNLNSGDVIWADSRSRFTYIPMCVKEEYARCIDEYFSQFGYKCNRVKIPNYKSRTYWNFVKTIGCNITGDIPQEDMQEIKGFFDNGITIWHDPTKFLDYTQNNTIV